MTDNWRSLLRLMIAGGVVAVLAACGTTLDAGVADADIMATPSEPISSEETLPVLVDEPAPGGNVTCEQLEHAFGFKLDYSEITDTFDGAWPDGISVTVSDGTFVAWSSTFPISAVIVKGGPTANVFAYDPASLADSMLAAPRNPSPPGNPPYALSNLTFCWNAVPDDEEPHDEPSVLDVLVTKTAHTTFERDYRWTVAKPETSGITALSWSPGQSFMAYYRVTVGLDDAVLTDSAWTVWGIITVLNGADSTEAATVSDVSDFIGEGIDVTVACEVTLPHVLEPGDSFTCRYDAALPDGEARTNRAQVTANDVTFDGSTAITFEEPAATRNACIEVHDNGGTGDPMVLSSFTKLGEVCIDDLDESGKKVFSYGLDLGPILTQRLDQSPSMCRIPFTNLAKARYPDGSYHLAGWTIEVDVDVPSCSDEEASQPAPA